MAEKASVFGLNPADVINIFWISEIGIDSDVDIGTLPISEWQLSVRHIFFQYRNNRCRYRMSDIADIEVDVDAHLWLSEKKCPVSISDNQLINIQVANKLISI